MNHRDGRVPGEATSYRWTSWRGVCESRNVLAAFPAEKEAGSHRKIPGCHLLRLIVSLLLVLVCVISHSLDAPTWYLGGEGLARAAE
jgi:hypothetical protein